MYVIELLNKMSGDALINIVSPEGSYEFRVWEITNNSKNKDKFGSRKVETVLPFIESSVTIPGLKIFCSK